MILEGIVTTLDAHGTLNIAAMGPDMASGGDQFVLRPFKTSRTFRNLQQTGVGVLHITDDVGLIARAAIKQIGAVSTRPAASIQGQILDTTGRYLEFRVLDLDASADRARITVATVASGHQTVDLFGLNRAQHAVVEAAILATRLDFLPRDMVRADLERLMVLVGKTGGPNEHEAFEMIKMYVQDFPTRF